jgi:hypothetical protein
MRCDITVIYVSHLSFAFLWVILWTVLVAQLSAILHLASLVSCHNFHSLCLSCRWWSRPSSSLLRSKSMNLHVVSLYAKAIGDVKLLAAFSASSIVWMCIQEEISSEAWLWNHSQSISVSTVAKISLALTWSNMWNEIGRWSEARASETVTSDTISLWCIVGGRLRHWNCKAIVIK